MTSLEKAKRHLQILVEGGEQSEDWLRGYINAVEALTQVTTALASHGVGQTKTERKYEREQFIQRAWESAIAALDEFDKLFPTEFPHD